MNTFTISHGYANDLDLWFGKIERKDGGKMTAGIEKTFKAMVRCAVGKNHTFVNMGTLANRTNVCHRTIERHIKILRDAGLINAVREEINGWKRTVYYFLAHPVIVKFRELRVGKTKPQQKKNETAKPDKPEATPDIEPETKQELSDDRDQDATQDSYAPDQQNVGNLSDYTFDRLNIETPSLSPSESAITHGHQEPPTWVKVRDRIIENDQLNLAAKYLPCIYAKIENESVILSVPNEISLQRIEKHYGQTLKNNFSFFGVKTIVFKVYSEKLQKKKNEEQTLQDQIQRQKQKVLQERILAEKQQQEAELNSLPLKKQFEVLLNQYPRKVGKWQAWKNFKKFVQAGEIPKTSKLLQIIGKNKMSQDWQRDDGRWIPGLSKFLKERRWLDEINT
ncbi:helix-turn-helix domain-containing protein [Desulfobacter curvatus]|uniref:helix-turn-helix domain-containing protein n=1 Tax=Desulfobacter curvatus TaxID=2290 RepID=UPI0003804CAB|nr:helix-turn-helix domain-containing protein [Desulfobacter curvatus]